MLDPRLLRSFVVLAEELHFSRAAERLHVAQPALTQQLHRLEQQVGARLVDRSSRSVELTAAGRAMLEPARVAVRAATQAEMAVREVEAYLGHPVNVGVDLYLDDVIPSLTECATALADMSLWISRMSEMHGQRMLVDAHLDAFVGFTPPSASHERSRVRAVDVPIVAMVHPGSELAEAQHLTLEELRTNTITIAGQSQEPERFHYWVNILSEGQGRQVLTLREVGPPGPIGQAVISALVGAGEAVAFGPPATLIKIAGELRLLPFDPPLSVPSYVSWNPGDSEFVDEFVECYRTWVAESPDGANGGQDGA